MVYKNEEGIACPGCEYRHTRPGEVFGHTRCSVHRPCTGFVYWEPSNCKHCTNFEISLKDLDPNTRYAQMGKLKGLLDKVRDKVRELDPQRNWQYMPIYNWVLAKFLYSQPEQAEHTNSPQYESLDVNGPSDQDTLQINNDDHDYDDEDQSESESVTEDDSGGDHNNILSDFCTPLLCIKANQSAQCNDEVHHVQEHLSQRTNNTPVMEEAARKRPLPPDADVRVGNEPAYGTYNPMLVQDHAQRPLPTDTDVVVGNKHAYGTSSPMLVQDHTQPMDVIPEQASVIDTFTHETWVKYNPLIHTRAGLI